MNVFHYQLKLMEFCGIVASSKDLSLRKRYAIDIYRIWNMSTTFYCIFSLIVFLCDTPDVLSIAESMAPPTTALTTLIKYIIFLIQYDKFFNIMDEINELNDEYQYLPNAKMILSRANKMSNRISLPLGIGCLMTTIFFILNPLINSNIDFWYYGIESPYELPFKAKYFYDATKTPAYEITYFVQICATIFVATFVCVMGSTFGCYCLHISAHFEILREAVNTMKLEEFVHYHRKVINITKRLNSLYVLIIFIEYFASGMTLIVTGLEIILVDDFGLILRSMFHACTGLADAAVYSYGSQKVLDSSLSLCDEIYLIDKNYMPVLMIAQRKLRFTTGFFEASLDTFSIVLSRTMSFITLLKSFVN